MKRKKYYKPPFTVISDLPGKRVDLHLKVYGHLPTKDCCDNCNCGYPKHLEGCNIFSL